ncbi:FK506-binding protein 4 [Kwoniella mangroviensis CBS 10435]|uniref:FK506-binding protein n=1 Tax=Kwoniella mangroviensis CBS 10435 TaxID=1331196 RepID=A0A1B9IZV1_9TREE|nr:FK506-binding protein 4 [Kwoniella mangroviensis CBS 10435]OCF74208.1 FK506-binding protein 4 [Kwoniella mangroviensis CBS 8886]
MAVKMNLWSLTLLPGERYPLFVRRDFQITNVALGEELVSKDGRSVVKVTHNPIPSSALESDSEFDSDEYDSEFDDEELDDEEDDEEEDDEEEDDEEEEEKPKAAKKADGVKKGEVDAEMDEDEDSEDEDYSVDDSDLDGEIEETNVITSLTAGRIEQATVNLTFVEGDVVIFETTGENAVHLLGNYIDQFPGISSDDESDSEFSGDDDYSDIYGSDDDIELDTDEEEAVAKITEIPVEKPAKKALPAAEAKPKKAEAPAAESKPAQKRKADDIDSPAKAAPAAAADGEVLSKNQKKKLAKKAKVEGAAPAVEKNEEKKPSKKILPSGLIIEDVKVGDGPVAKTGKRLGMRYIGKLTTGKQFDANTSGKPFTFVLGKGEVIRGWDEGLAGMAVGGERRLTIPPQLAYGSQKLPGIPKNSTLKFDVKLVSIN